MFPFLLFIADTFFILDLLQFPQSHLPLLFFVDACVGFLLGSLVVGQPLPFSLSLYIYIYISLSLSLSLYLVGVVAAKRQRGGGLLDGAPVSDRDC